MSRRKQTQPRHIESEDDVATILQNGENTENLSTTPSGGDAHVCGKCREEFPDLETFIAHKKTCSRKRVVVMFDGENEDNSDIDSQFDKDEVSELRPSKIPRMADISEMNGEVGSDGEANMDHSDAEGEEEEDQDQNEILADEDVIDEDEDMVEDSYLKLSMNGDVNLSEDEEDDDPDVENDEDDEKDFDIEKLSDSKSDLSLQLPHLMLPFPAFMPNSNVTLEPISATKAAVAQFAENNLPPNDLAVLHTTLYSLQQQQLVQLQLIHQLQQQLIMGMSTPSPPPNGYFTPPSSSSAMTTHPLKELSSCIKSAGLSDDILAITSSSSSTTSSSQGSSSTTTSTTAPSTSSTSSSSAVTSLSSSKPIPSSQPLPSNDGESRKLSVSEPSDFARLSMLVERSQYASDDPFFRHKCRLCHKVFGSDSALQIHIRSHTGERPFKCNICGNRFSTRGNLKVHFERHKAKYPHVKMNPNPVPEHLDKVPIPPMPLLGSSYSSGAPPPLSLPARMLNSLPSLPPPIMAPSPFGLPISHHGITPHGMPSPHVSSHFAFGGSSGSHGHQSHSSLFHLSNSGSSKSVSHSSESKPSPSPTSLSTPSSVTTPSPSASEAVERKSPKLAETANTSISPTSSSSSAPSQSKSSVTNSTPDVSKPKMTSPLMSPPPTSHMPSLMPHPMISPLPSVPPLPPPPPPLNPSVPFGSPPPARDSILPSKMIEHDENLEQYMEINRSETSKLQQLVDNLENKVSDPNQCVICHRVLSCKSALQMHYRIHTGERPFKCKICGRAFTTKGNLKTHMGVHRMKPPLRMMHQCPVCHKSFTNLLVLQQHIRSHAGMHGMHPMPDMNHFRMFRDIHHPLPPEWHHKPFDLSVKQDPDKELDLSKSSMSLHAQDISDKYNDNDDASLSSKDPEEDALAEEAGLTGIDDEIMDIDESRDEEGEKDLMYSSEELPSRDSGAGSEEGRSSSIEENQEHQDRKAKNDPERPASNASSGSVSQDSGRSPSPKYINQSSHHPFLSFTSTHSTPIFNTSLAALEERVRAIDTSMTQSPLGHFRPIFSMNGGPLPMTNGDVSPTSPNAPYSGESGSESINSGEEGSKPGTPAGSDGGSSVGSGYLVGLDLRGGEDRRSNTTCNICLKTFACRSALSIHYRSHTKERPFKCKVCDRSFSTKGNMRQHMLTHKIRDLPKSFNENSNSKLGENNNSLDAPDMESKSQEEDSTEQPDSPQNTNVSPGNSSNGPASNGTSSSNHSNNNVGSNHTDNSPFVRQQTPLKHQCQVCQKGFSSASALQIHIRTHTGDKPFKCNVCGKAFTTKGNLKVHMGTHMWNNSPSRRGRRMSIEPPFMMAHKDNPYMSGFPHRSPDFFPYQFPPFLGGMTPPKMNEISVIQNLAGGLGHMPPMSVKSELPSPHRSSSKSIDSVSDNHDGPAAWNKNSESGRNSDAKVNVSSSGELDLSMKSSTTTRSPSPMEKMSTWSAKNFQPTSPLERMQSFHLKGDSHKGVVA